MNHDCDLIQDLLPIYAERIASQSTCRLVEEHLNKCDRCKAQLADMQQTMKFPADTDTTLLTDMGIGFRKKSLLSVTCAVLMLLLVLHSVLVLCTVPVWMPAEDAIVEIVGVQPVITMNPPRNQFVFLTSPEVLRLHQSGSAVWCEGYRIAEPNAEAVASGIFLNPNTEESLFYRGYFAGEKNTLLYGSAEKEIAVMPQEPGADVDQTLEYLFYTTLYCGILCLLIGLPLCRKLGKGVAWIGILLLCIAISTYFVTNGYFALRQDPFEPHTLNTELLFRMGHILIFGVLLWSFAICLWNRVAMARKGRRDIHGTEL